MKKDQLTRRDLITRAGLALGGLVTLGSLQACGEEESTSNDPAPSPAPSPAVADFPYDQHLSASYQIDPAAVQEAAYHAYYAGGCCHGSFSALLSHLSTTVGAPFSLLPVNFGKFGAGGIDGYGSLCGSLLGAELIINMIVSDAVARKNMIWELMRWYETYAFPAYVPVTIDPLESTTLSFTGGAPTMQAVAPGSHLCHASVSKWCAVNAVTAGSGDKKARCARLTADVAGKAVALLNAYLAASPRAYGTIAVADPNGSCDGCHTATATVATAGMGPSVASDMSCVSCHDPAVHP